MTMNQNMNPVGTPAPSSVFGHACFTGAGAAPPTVSAATKLPAIANLASAHGGTPVATVARTSAGLYTFTFNVGSSPAIVHNVIAVAEGTSDLDATIRSIAITSGALVVVAICKTAAGVATDLASGVDFLRMTIFGSQSNVAT